MAQIKGVQGKLFFLAYFFFFYLRWRVSCKGNVLSNSQVSRLSICRALMCSRLIIELLRFKTFLFWYTLYHNVVSLKLSCDMRFNLRFNLRLLHAIAFSRKLRWFEPTKVISLKMQQHAVNARSKRVWQRAFTLFHCLPSDFPGRDKDFEPPWTRRTLECCRGWRRRARAI